MSSDLICIFWKRWAVSNGMGGTRKGVIAAVSTDSLGLHHYGDVWSSSHVHAWAQRKETLRVYGSMGYKAAFTILPLIVLPLSFFPSVEYRCTPSTHDAIAPYKTKDNDAQTKKPG